MFVSDSPETVLVVEDDAGVLRTVTSLLDSAGFRTLPASNAEMALTTLAESADVRVVLLDVAIPKVSGPQIARRMLEIRPELRIVFMTGHLADVVERLTDGMSFEVVQKPFKLHALLAAIRRTSHAESAAAPNA